MLHALKLVI